ncbi:ABC transporter permease [Thermosipho sp. 1063]|uniref:ABC transporter permease n=1 Tax=unclassified Thermosipho (in: thermotogales) TaxID=2676525 RepID=UPI0009492E69|nr:MULTISPECIES: ABC transporter permease [unclassified Thermosipho (in: thermotogales)]ANQ54023.1 ABC transporter permease [Thermosipho sp. 1070]APT72468.1 ABC transporter permease [Thermosipho sp. 1063]OOC42648.1 ABC transporter permease [Thermosipho sp. 1074]
MNTKLWMQLIIVLVFFVLLFIHPYTSFGVILPLFAIITTAFNTKKIHHYIFLIISLLLYFSAFFGFKYFFIFSPRFNYLLSIVLYLFSLPLPGLFKFIRNRIYQMLILLIIYITVVFFIFLAMPGDYTSKFLDPKIMKQPEMMEKIKKLFGVGDPWYVKYAKHMRNFFNLELGISFSEYPKPVEEIIAERLPRTVFLFLMTTLSSYILGYNLGKRIAWKRGGISDKVATFVGIIFWTIFTPFFMLIMIWLFGVVLKIFPISGFIEPSKWLNVSFSTQDVFIRLLLSAFLMVVFWTVGLIVATFMKTKKSKTVSMLSITFSGISIIILYWLFNGYGYYALDIIYHVILPVLSLTMLGFAGSMLVMRDTMLEIIKEDYITTAKAKGLPDKVVRDKHAARTALLPLVTSFVLSLATTVSGGVITETMFSWKGMGLTLLNATLVQDTPLAMGCLTFTGVFILIAHLVADILYAILDPRIRY